MSAFVANANPIPATTTVKSGDFWPDVDPAVVRAELRIDGSVTNERLRAAIVSAVLTVNDELQAWQAMREAAGYAKLADVPATTVDGHSRFVVLYRRAISMCTAAEVAERYRTFDATDSGGKSADAMTPTVDELRRDQAWAIRDFLGAGRMTVELI